ncbi:uncharacterized protein LOC143491158 [Brachyhypopomus gauderio]|uniref:uncharacterized protein LOC143491158 n=1 Tax=Brachyhypopomus gauderio TaxID=698409 RepID=UPI004041B927
MSPLQVSPCHVRTVQDQDWETRSSDAATHVSSSEYLSTVICLSRLLQLMGLLSLALLVLDPGQCSPAVGRCVAQDSTPVCIPNLQDYYAQTTNLPNRLNERSLAAWTYAENIDLNRVPQVIYEAMCLTSHSCRGVDSTSRVESVPLAIKMPVLRLNTECQIHSIEFESINIACICATARQN